MNPTAAAALRWGGAVVGLLLVVWLTVPAMLNALQESIQFGDEDEASVFLEGGDAEDEAEPADDDEPEPAGEDVAEDDDGGNGDNGNDNGNGGDDGDGDNGANGDGDGEADDGAAVAEVEGGTYEVQSGDTLFGIADRTLGDGHRWTEIAELNGLGDGRDLRVGQELQLPNS